MKQITSILSVILLILLASFFAGCTNNDDNNNDSNNTNNQLISVDYSKSTSENVQKVVDANNQFAFNLYSKYQTKEGNIFFSPYSISSALAMTYEGAKGQTATEMENVLHYYSDSNIRQPSFAKIYSDINGKDKKYTLSTANALWAQKDYSLLNDYVVTAQKYYGGKTTNLDFASDAEKSRTIINSWVESQTNNKIKNLVPPGTIDATTKLVLTNAIYFKGDWLKKFDSKQTTEKEFRVDPFQTVKTQMMSLTGEKSKFNYTETDSIQAIELPYVGNEVSMIVILPKDGNIAQFEQSFSPNTILELESNMRERQINVYLPKFKFETQYSMADDLKQMGMPSAFSPTNADFSGMTGNNDLYIGAVIHKAYIDVNEEGTEAAAATAVIKMTSAVGGKPLEFNANHPFIFVIQDKNTGSILFMGRVNDPTK